MTTRDIPALTSIRGVAALWVVFGHMIGPISLALGYHEPPPLLRNVAAGDQFAVDVFFVLSGYVMVVAHGDHIAPRQFFLHRLARVLPLHLVMLSVAVAGYYLVHYVPLDASAYEPAKLIFYFTLTFAWFGLPPAWNPPSWSLSVEAFAYLLFPLIQAVRRRLSQSAMVGMIAILIVMDMAILHIIGFPDTGPAALLRGLCGFCGGALLRFAIGDRALPWAPLIGSSMIALCAVFGLYQLAVLAIFLLLAGLGANRNGAIIALLRTAPLVWLGDISYSIYLTHFPLLIGAQKTFRRMDWLQSPDGQAIFCVGYLACVLFLATLSWRWIETPARRAIRSAGAA